MTNSTPISVSETLEEDVLENNGHVSDLKEDETVKKLPGAFRTISEVAEEIHVPQHVLRFWETRFKQVQPVKRSGGRRYYRAEDITLLQYISELLYTQGYTIKGVQRLLDDDILRFDSKVEDEKHNVNTVAQQQSDNQPKNESLDHQEHVVASRSISDEQINHELTLLKEENSRLLHVLKLILTEIEELKK